MRAYIDFPCFQFSLNEPAALEKRPNEDRIGPVLSEPSGNRTIKRIAMIGSNEQERNYISELVDWNSFDVGGPKQKITRGKRILCMCA